MERPNHSIKMKASHRNKALSEIVKYCANEYTHRILMEHDTSSQDGGNETVKELVHLHLLKSKPIYDATPSIAIPLLRDAIASLDKWINEVLQQLIADNFVETNDGFSRTSDNTTELFNSTCSTKLHEMLKMREKAFNLIAQFVNDLTLGLSDDELNNVGHDLGATYRELKVDLIINKLPEYLREGPTLPNQVWTMHKHNLKVTVQKLVKGRAPYLAEMNEVFRNCIGQTDIKTLHELLFESWFELHGVHYTENMQNTIRCDAFNSDLVPFRKQNEPTYEITFPPPVDFE